MDVSKNVQAFTLIEKLLSNGHKFGTLPIPKERAAAIAEGREDASEGDIQALSLAAGDNGAA
jgi:hypothetical protein